jgi:hypothetical protein
MMIILVEIFVGHNFLPHMKMVHNSYHGHFPILAAMARLIIAINVVFMGASSKYSKNADQQPKQFLRIYKW